MRCLTIVASLFVLASPAFASGLDFKMKNDTGYDIEMVMVDPASSDEWSGNILDQPILADGDTADVTFTGDPESCKWDIRVEWADDDEPVVWRDLNLCQISKITLKYDEKSGETTAELE